MPFMRHHNYNQTHPRRMQTVLKKKRDLNKPLNWRKSIGSNPDKDTDTISTSLKQLNYLSYFSQHLQCKK